MGLDITHVRLSCDTGVSATSFVDTHARGRTYCFQLTLPMRGSQATHVALHYVRA